MFNAVAIVLHLLAINIWVGGTFFSVMILSRAVNSLPVEERYPFALQVMARFFFWVWMAVIILLGSGGWMVFSLFQGIMHIPLYVMLMMGLAMLMVVVFVAIYYLPWRKYKNSVSIRDWPACSMQLSRIRLFSKLNMGLGISIVLIIGAGPHYLG